MVTTLLQSTDSPLRSVQLIIRGKGCSGYLDSSIPKPSLTVPYFANWGIQNSKDAINLAYSDLKDSSQIFDLRHHSINLRQDDGIKLLLSLDAIFRRCIVKNNAAASCLVAPPCPLLRPLILMHLPWLFDDTPTLVVLTNLFGVIIVTVPITLKKPAGSFTVNPQIGSHTTNARATDPSLRLQPNPIKRKHVEAKSDLISLAPHSSGSSFDPDDTKLQQLDMPIALRKGTRLCTQHPISDFLGYSHLSRQMRALVTNILETTGPANIDEALKHKH
ncbi:hypothetical protein ZIOFF_028157 [Zingiber officinale]|uniref:Uncharacterized protein n=1 Tax=Zingiber officinale TaxID=94328 RepID=A0A8J5LEP4_ZINOF|nr:hypothetical protein ZIOFF_028157 [Zingiber officinale]